MASAANVAVILKQHSWYPFNFNTCSLLDITSGSWRSWHFITGSLKTSSIQPSVETSPDHVAIMGY